MLEIPRGYASTSNSEAEAKRELVEETGLVADRFIAMGSVVPNSSVLATRVELFAAKCARLSGSAPIKDAREQCEFLWLSVLDTMDAVKDNRITDCITLSALLRAKLFGLI